MLRKRHNGSIHRSDSQQAVKSPPLMVRNGTVCPKFGPFSNQTPSHSCFFPLKFISRLLFAAVKRRVYLVLNTKKSVWQYESLSLFEQHLVKHDTVFGLGWHLIRWYLCKRCESGLGEWVWGNLRQALWIDFYNTWKFQAEFDLLLFVAAGLSWHEPWTNPQTLSE